MDDLVARLKHDLTGSMKAGDRQRTSVLRMLLSEVKTAETAAASQRRSAEEAVAAYAKRMRKAVEEYRRLGRPDQAEQNEQELKIVEDYLPKPLSREAIQQIVADVVAQQGLTSAKQVGEAMRLVMGQCGDRAEGRVVQEIVREMLAGS
jgi:hypothetical protein